jgi:ABC-2 type transport system permease protein
MNGRLIGVLVAKDVSLYFRNRFFAFITALGLVAYAVTYFLLPTTADEELEVAFYAPEVPGALGEALAEEGVALNSFDSEVALQQAILDGDYQIGLSLPPEAMQKIVQGEKGQLKLFVASELPDELRGTAEILLRELGFMISGQPLNLETDVQVMGPDLIGEAIAPRQRMLPLLAVVLLFMEMIGLASLIGSEVAAGTLQAVLITPVTTPTLFVSKAVTGVGLAFLQAVLLLAITGGLKQEPLLMLTTLLLGSLLVTGIAFLVATTGHDIVSVLAAGIPVMLVMFLPAFNVLLPGVVSDWVRIIPSYYLVEPVHRVMNLNATWGDVGGYLLILLGFALGFLGLGVVALRRKFS